MLLTGKDSQIALIELNGARDRRQIEHLNRLRSDRYKLKQRLQLEVG